ncbi:hypothetical protein ZWY2020_020682 [Hordeum vulgare]|nr:hypothetical protein ZWY2020_020682 [Hordeum vulgare]
MEGGAASLLGRERLCQPDVDEVAPCASNVMMYTAPDKSYFRQKEVDVFLICSNVMMYNAHDTIYFRQVHSIQGLARKMFQEPRDEGIRIEMHIPDYADDGLLW